MKNRVELLRVTRSALPLVVFLVLAIPREAHGDAIHHFVLRGEGGGGLNLAGSQSQQDGGGAVVEGSGRLGIVLADPFTIELSFTSWWFPDNHGGGQQYSVLGGFRIQPRVGSVGRFWLNPNAGLGISGDRMRFAFDAALGFEFAATRALGIGPFARWGMILPNSPPDASAIPMYVVGGISLSLRVPEPEAHETTPSAPRDTDRDGVNDDTDLCPTVPQGAHPDPRRPGCPLVDSDGDGIDDGRDVCPNEAQGEHPDPQRLGCPSRDSDADGVLDADDRCPTTLAGAHPDPERAGCPDVDDDADGVLNHQDQCPHEPQGIHPDPARAGCPAPDRDHDSVPDAVDACPDQPGAPNPDPRRNGCPGLVRVEHGMIVIIHPVFFATDRDRILRNSFPVLQAVADAMTAQPEIRRVSIEGHTDNQGTEAHNQDLSQRRAQSVMSWLVAHHVASERIEAHGFGSRRSILPNESDVGRAANRRVEFHILDPAPANEPASPSSGPSLDASTASTGSASAPAAPASDAAATGRHHYHHHAPEQTGHSHHHGSH
jgi:outer membrane protein OmpA-like peptidoglycan-associated protein